MLNQILSDRVLCCQCDKSFSQAEAQKWGNGWIYQDDLTGDLIQEGTCLECQQDNSRRGSLCTLGKLAVGDRIGLVKNGKRQTYIVAGLGFQQGTTHLLGENGNSSGDAKSSIIVRYLGKSDM